MLSVLVVVDDGCIHTIPHPPNTQHLPNTTPTQPYRGIERALEKDGLASPGERSGPPGGMSRPSSAGGNSVAGGGTVCWCLVWAGCGRVGWVWMCGVGVDLGWVWMWYLGVFGTWVCLVLGCVWYLVLRVCMVPAVLLHILYVHFSPLFFATHHAHIPSHPTPIKPQESVLGDSVAPSDLGINDPTTTATTSCKEGVRRTLMRDGAARKWKHLNVLERDVLLVLNAICKVRGRVDGWGGVVGGGMFAWGGWGGPGGWGGG